MSATRIAIVPATSNPSEDQPVAIVGTGAIGTMLAGYLAEAGRPVLVCGRPIDAVTIEDGSGSRSYEVGHLFDPGDLPPVRWAILATKIPQTVDVAGWLAAFGPDVTVVVAQNGIDHQQRIGSLTRAAVVPVLVFKSAERLGAGRVRVGDFGRGLVLPDDSAARATAKFLAETGLPVETSADFTTEAWVKLLINVALNPITALTGRRLEVMRLMPIADLAYSLALETAAVARAAGAELSDGQALEWVDMLRALPPSTSSSMLADRLAGRALEHDGIVGPVVRFGEFHGIPTPVSRAVLALLGALAPPDSLAQS